jgi:preprotein translocase subunit SecA
MDGIQQDIATSVFRSSTSVESFDSFLSSLPQTMVHDEVSLLGGPVAAPAGAAPTGGQLPPQPMPGGSPFRDLPSAAATATREAPKVGRNDACPCGSGKKYKKCCGN